MDLRRHVTAGRLSELFGDTTLDTDKLIRTMGWRRIAEQEMALVSPQTREMLQAYADGVNAYLDSHSPTEMALQYSVLGLAGLDYTPEDVDTGRLAGLAQGDGLGPRGNMSERSPGCWLGVDHTPAEVASSTRLPLRTARADRHAGAASSRPSTSRVGDEPATRVAGRRTPRPASAPCGRPAPPGALPELMGRGVGHRQQLLGGRRRPHRHRRPVAGQRPAPRASASRASGCRWACTAARSTAPARSMSRASPSPAFPGVIIGHNADIAWGFTNLGPDVADLLPERVVDGDQWRTASSCARSPYATRRSRSAVRTTSS